MNDDSDDALRKFGQEVLRLAELYDIACQTAERSAVTAFQLQMHLCHALAQVAVLRIVRADDTGERA